MFRYEQMTCICGGASGGAFRGLQSIGYNNHSYRRYALAVERERSIGHGRLATKVNAERVYYNYGGQLPPVTLDPEPVTPPPSPDGTSKLITDTTLRDGAQDSRLAIFPADTRLKYYDLLHRLDNGTGAIYAVEAFIYQKRDVWTLEKLLERGYEWPRVTTWTRATPKDIKLLMEVSQGQGEGDGHARLRVGPPHLRQAWLRVEGRSDREVPAADPHRAREQHRRRVCTSKTARAPTSTAG